MVKYTAEWWKAGLDPVGAAEAFATTALVSAVIQVLMDERLASGELTEEDLMKILRGGKVG